MQQKQFFAHLENKIVIERERNKKQTKEAYYYNPHVTVRCACQWISVHLLKCTFWFEKKKKTSEQRKLSSQKTFSNIHQI